MTRQKRSELPQDNIICPHCNQIQDWNFLEWLTQTDCVACGEYFSIKIIERPDLYITKPL